MRTVYGQPVTLEVDRLTDELLARIDLATGITAAQRVSGAVPILNNAETALIWSNFTTVSFTFDALLPTFDSATPTPTMDLA